MASPHRIPVRNEDILVRELGKETVFLSPDGRTIHTLDEVGTFIWAQIDGRTDLVQIVAEICRVFAVTEATAAADLDELVTEMVHKGLVTLQS
jgi:hypothetical protein